jgi:hypothetical protein
MARRSALLTLLLVLLFPLFGVEKAGPSFRIGIVSLDTGLEGMAEVVAASAKAYGPRIHLDDRQHQVMLEKQNLHLEQERIDALHAAYEKQDAATVAALQQEQVIEEISRVLDCNYTVEPYQSELATLLRSGKDTLDWYMQHSQYDGLFILQSQAMGDLNRILVDFLFIERTTLLDRLVQYGSYRSLSKELDAHMFRLLGSPDQGALCFEQGNTAFTVFVDGFEHTAPDDPLFLPIGEHELVCTSLGYEDKHMTVTVRSKAIQYITVSLTKIQHPALQISSQSGSATWFADGRLLGTGLSISLLEPSYPMVLSGTKEGFESRILQLDTPLETLEVSFTPVELSNEVLVLDSQRDFYKRLRNTILVFGGYVGCIALSKTYQTSQPLWQVGMVATSSLALVGSVALVMELASYAARAGSHL